MGLFDGKIALIMGVANNRSIATGIAEFLHQEGAELAFSHLPDDRGRMEARVRQAVGHLNPKFLRPCDVNKDEDLDRFFLELSQTYPRIDMFVHSIAFASIDEIRNPTVAVSRRGFLEAQETSVFSFLNTSYRASQLMSEGGSIVTLSYFGGEKVVPGYNLMGLSKATLECAVRYAAFDLGPKNIRVNALSAGVIKTLAASAIGDFGDMLSMNAAMAPMERNVSQEEVGRSAGYLLSHLASGVTGEVLHVDGGYHIMGGPAKALQLWGVRPRDFR